MEKMIRPLVGSELSNIVDYFLSLTPEDDKRMGTDRKNLPTRDEWIQLLIEDSKKELKERQFYYLGFFVDNQVIGHSGINNIKFGEEACIHFHIWVAGNRRNGFAAYFFKEAIQYYFQQFNLRKIIAEPNTGNLTPNKCLPRLGFKLSRTYRTKPSMLSLEHDVNRYELIRPDNM